MPLTFSKQYLKNDLCLPSKLPQEQNKITCNRFVSFEESEPSHDDIPILKSSKHSLKRPFSSMCLVDLAGEQSTTQFDNEQCIQVISTNNDDSSSSWDHFVDIIPPDECHKIENQESKIESNNWFQQFQTFFTKNDYCQKSSFRINNESSQFRLEQSIKRLRIE